MDKIMKKIKCKNENCGKEMEVGYYLDERAKVMKDAGSNFGLIVKCPDCETMNEIVI